MKKSVRTAFSIFSLTFLFLFGGCELGMGASPDLEAPIIQINSLESGGTVLNSSELSSAIYCKREVVVKGTAVDNEKVKSVTVDIKWDGDKDYSYFADCQIKDENWTGALHFPKEGVASLKFTAADAKNNYSTK